MVTAAPRSNATLVFAANDKLSGSTGCNSFAGTYTASGSQLTIALGPMTQKACTDPALIAQESAVTRQLPMVTAYTMGGGVLRMTGAGGTELFTYNAAATSLEGTSWKVTGVNNGKGAVEATSLTEKLTANFDKANAFTGFGGCNQLRGAYTLAGTNGVSLGPLASTKKTCGSAVDQLEGQYATALSHVASFEIAGTTLTLRDSTNATQVTAERA